MAPKILEPKLKSSDACLTCGRSEIANGEDHCYKCLGIPRPPIKWEKEDINERVADFSRVGSNEWLEEMWANREHLPWMLLPRPRGWDE